MDTQRNLKGNIAMFTMMNKCLDFLNVQLTSEMFTVGMKAPLACLIICVTHSPSNKDGHSNTSNLQILFRLDFLRYEPEMKKNVILFMRKSFLEFN